MKTAKATRLPFLALALVAPVLPGHAQAPQRAASETVPVTVKNFARAESDLYFAKTVKEGAFGKLRHDRAPVSIEKQNVVRMNRDTLYSTGVFDLDAGPVTITLPDTGKRFMSVLVITEDHYAPLVAYAPGTYTIDNVQAGTRYAMLAIRTFADPTDPSDVKAANALQDQTQVTQPGGPGKFEIAKWDPISQGKVRDHLSALAALGGCDDTVRMGTRAEVDAVCHLQATAIGWGLNPPAAAVYDTVYPKANDGRTVHKLTVRDVPVDGFWSISVYNAKGYFEKNAHGSYSINNVTGVQNADGSYTIQFGGCTKQTQNCIATPPGWNYAVRMYRPRKDILDGTWRFPQAVPAN